MELCRGIRCLQCSSPSASLHHSAVWAAGHRRLPRPRGLSRDLPQTHGSARCGAARSRLPVLELTITPWPRSRRDADEGREAAGRLGSLCLRCGVSPWRCLALGRVLKRRLGPCTALLPTGEGQSPSYLASCPPPVPSVLSSVFCCFPSPGSAQGLEPGGGARLRHFGLCHPSPRCPVPPALPCACQHPPGSGGAGCACCPFPPPRIPFCSAPLLPHGLPGFGLPAPRTTLGLLKKPSWGG